MLQLLITKIYTKTENVFQLFHKAMATLILTTADTEIFSCTMCLSIVKLCEIKKTFSDIYDLFELPGAFPPRIPHSLLLITYQMWVERWDEPQPQCISLLQSLWDLQRTELNSKVLFFTAQGRSWARTPIWRSFKRARKKYYMIMIALNACKKCGKLRT